MVGKALKNQTKMKKIVFIWYQKQRKYGIPRENGRVNPKGANELPTRVLKHVLAQTIVKPERRALKQIVSGLGREAQFKQKIYKTRAPLHFRC